MLSDKDQDTIISILQYGKSYHNSETKLFDLNVEYDTPTTGLKDRLAALPNGGQDDLNLLPALNGLTVAQLNEIAFVVTAGVSPIIQAARDELASTYKVNV